MPNLSNTNTSKFDNGNLNTNISEDLPNQLASELTSPILYFAGIGGIGISALALIFKNLGFNIIGSDAVETPAVIKLRKNGINVYVPQSYENVDKNYKNILLAIKTNALPDDHIELTALKDFNIPVLSYPQALGILTNIFPSIGIAGTHGKTTTTALISKILLTANYDILGLIGAFYKDFNNLNYRLPKNLSKQNKEFIHSLVLKLAKVLKGLNYKTNHKFDFLAKDIMQNLLKDNLFKNNIRNFTGKNKTTLPYFVFEADEYKDAFLNHTFEYLVITSIDYDHADYFKTQQDYFLSFAKVINNTRKAVIVNLGDKNINKVLELAKRLNKEPIDSMELMGASDSINKFPKIIDASIYLEQAKNYPLYFKAKFLTEDLSFAISLANALKIDENTIKTAISQYTGVWRRFEIIKNTKPYVINDYAHNPKKLLYAGLALVDFIKQKGLKCGAIYFEPHQYNRLYSFQNEFLQTIKKLLKYKEICKFYITEIYGARSSKQDKMRINTKKFIRFLKDNLVDSLGNKIFYAGEVEDALVSIEKLARFNGFNKSNEYNKSGDFTDNQNKIVNRAYKYKDWLQQTQNLDAILITSAGTLGAKVGQILG